MNKLKEKCHYELEQSRKKQVLILKSITSKKVRMFFEYDQDVRNLASAIEIKKPIKVVIFLGYVEGPAFCFLKGVGNDLGAERC